MTPEQVRDVRRALYRLKSPLPSGSEHYRSGFDDGVEASIAKVEGMEAAPTGEVEYHYVMTLRAPAPGGHRIENYDGLYDWATGTETEQDVYWRIFTDACRYHDIPREGTVVMFWSIKPNRPVHPTT